MSDDLEIEARAQLRAFQDLLDEHLPKSLGYGLMIFPRGGSSVEWASDTPVEEVMVLVKALVVSVERARKEGVN